MAVQHIKIYRSIFSIIEHSKKHGLVIYGAGFWGEMSYKIFALFDILPTFFCDDDINKQGTYFHDGDIKIPIISLEEAAEQIPDAVYFVAADREDETSPISPRYKMNQKLHNMSVNVDFLGFHPARYLFLLDGGFEALYNPLPQNNNSFSTEKLNNIIILSPIGRAGSTLFSTLLDGHPNIISIPCLGATTSLIHIYQNRLKFLKGREFVLELTSQMSSFLPLPDYCPEDKCQLSHTRISKWCKAADDTMDKAFLINTRIFVSSLMSMLSTKSNITFSTMLKAIFAAYANASGRQYISNDNWIIWDYHGYNLLTQADSLINKNDFSRLEHWFIVREPIQNLLSTYKMYVNEKNIRGHLNHLGQKSSNIKRLQELMGNECELNKDTQNKIVKFVKFEDLKMKTAEVIKSICKHLNIRFDECMLTPTINGVDTFFPKSLSEKLKKNISVSNSDYVNYKDYSGLLSSFDILRLNIVFQSFKNAFGYPCDVPNASDFSHDFLRELFTHPFKFEAVINQASAELRNLSGGGITDELPLSCHDYIAELFINHILNDSPKLHNDILEPVHTE